MSPIRKSPQRASAAALVDWPKIHDADRGGWAMWFASQGVDDPGSVRGPSFDDPSLLRSAVLAGQGAGLLPAPLVEPYIEDGRLVAVGAQAGLEGGLSWSARDLQLGTSIAPREPGSLLSNSTTPKGGEPVSSKDGD
jgi:DNA-binding transcriptional LysR family regulator